MNATLPAPAPFPFGPSWEEASTVARDQSVSGTARTAGEGTRRHAARRHQSSQVCRVQPQAPCHMRHLHDANNIDRPLPVNSNACERAGVGQNASIAHQNHAVPQTPGPPPTVCVFARFATHPALTQQRTQTPDMLTSDTRNLGRAIADSGRHWFELSIVHLGEGARLEWPTDRRRQLPCPRRRLNREREALRLMLLLRRLLRLKLLLLERGAVAGLNGLPRRGGSRLRLRLLLRKAQCHVRNGAELLTLRA